VRIVGEFSFNEGAKVVRKRHAKLLDEVRTAIAGVDAKFTKTKTSREKTMPGAVLYSPRAINNAFKAQFGSRGWETVRVKCDYPTKYYVKGEPARVSPKGAFREMDFVKNGLGVEVQFGKYAFMVYNVCAKMTIFRNLQHITCGIEIVPIKSFAEEMSSGVSYFEQFVWDLEARGVSNIDVPVLILGIDV
jgi:Restriction endonuclease BglII